MKVKLKKRYLQVYSVWVVIALFTSTQLYLKTLEANGTDSWAKLFFIQLLVWSLWAFLCPLIFWLGQTFRIDKQNRIKGVLIHLVASVIIVLSYLATYSLIWNLIGTSSFNQGSFVAYFKVFFLNLFHWHFFIYMAIIGIAHAITYQEELKTRQQKAADLEKKLLLSELNVLKAQLSPHFLFNTINNVIGSIERGKNQVATGMLLHLSDFLRISLEEKSKMIPLEKELNYVRKYLAIEKFRNPALEVEIQTQEQSLAIEVPSLILQPLVENAIKHGITKQKDAKRITLGSEIKDGFLLIFVYNEGPGLTEAHKRNKGIGIENTQLRLNKVYGALGKLDIFSVNDGVMVEIRIPLAENAKA